MACWKQSDQYSSRCKCWYPLLPAFSARILFALRNLFGIACCAALALHPVTSQLIQGQILLGLSFIIATQSTLGATIQSSTRLFFAGGIAAAYCLIIVNFIPRNIYFAVGATNIFVLVMVYTDLPAIVRRFSILPTCIILLQWFNKPYINTSYVLHAWASLTMGGVFAVMSLCIPLPAIPTAYRECVIRMQFIARQIRREITAILLLISEYHDTHLNDDYNDKSNCKTVENNKIDGDDIELARKSYFDEGPYNYSTSFENLKDDHLLQSDIEDLHSLVREELKQMERVVAVMSFEPYFLLLKLLNFIRRLLRHVPYLRKFFKKPTKLQTHFQVWATSFSSLYRIISGMLSLDQHHYAFVGQRKLINATCLLVDKAFNFLDATLPYTILSTKRINIEEIISCRLKVEEALENFFDTYAQVRESQTHLNMSNTDSIRLNTFLLLILRLVHLIITAAESSETPGAHLEISLEPTTDPPIKRICFYWKALLSHLSNYIGLRISSGKCLRAIKTSLSVLISAIIALKFRERLKADNWVYWAPMTTAIVSDSSEGGTIRLSLHRLVAVLFGSTYAYIIILIAHDRLAIGIFISLFVAFMAYIKTDVQKEYFSVVCGQSASIIAFLSNQEGFEGPNKTVLARTSLTFLGIFIHVFISNLILPISARQLTKKRVVTMINNVSIALKVACDDFCSFIGSTTESKITLTDSQAILSSKSAGDFMNRLAKTEQMVDSFPALLEEALSEPNFWKRPFTEVKDRYYDISQTIRRIIRNVRFIHRCTTILKAEARLYLALETRCQLRRASVISTTNTEMKKRCIWTLDELRNQKQLQTEIDIPLTIFMTNAPNSPLLFQKNTLKPNTSSSSFRMENTKSYEPILQHISMLEKYIQEVMMLTKQLIIKQSTVDVGSFQLQGLYSEEILDKHRKENTFLNSSTYNITMNSVTKHQLNTKTRCMLCTCCRRNQQQVNQPPPSLRRAVDIMLASLIEFLYANNRFTRTELLSIQSIGDILAFHTLSYALKDLVEATTDLAKNARRIKHIDIRTLALAEDEQSICC